MKITYLNHSGFLLEWPDCYWLFDYYRGRIPKLDAGKKLIVFCSHSHGDHFNPAVFALAQVYPRAAYVFSNQVRAACKKLLKTPGGVRIGKEQYACICGETVQDMNPAGTAGRPQAEGESSGTVQDMNPAGRLQADGGDGASVQVPVPEIQFLQSRTDTELDDGCGVPIRVHTLLSTDCGCAFYLEYLGYSVYHSGDLHWWTWPGESEAENRKMTADFKKELAYLEGKKLDLAFTVLDPRQEGDYALGLNELLHRAEVRRVFPMHFWNEFGIIDRYLNEYPPQDGTKVYRITEDGQSWEPEDWE